MNVIQLSRKKFETLVPLVLSRDVMSTEELLQVVKSISVLPVSK